MKRFLIVGAGLSGICVAERLLQRGVSVKVIDQVDQPSSTAVATGMYKRLNKSWMADELVAELRHFYRGLESKLGVQLLQDIEFKRCIPSQDYAVLWIQRLEDQAFQKFIGPISNGFGSVFESGILDCELLVKSYVAHLVENDLLLNEAFIHDDLKVSTNHVTYKSQTYDGVVFCEGPYASKNPHFHWLPFKPCKGEWIIVQTDRAVTDVVVNDQINIIPLGDNKYKLSSTYEWDDLTWNKTSKAADELLAAFERIFKCNTKIIDQQVGIRPSAADRRPYIGSHPRQRNLHIFNGLGTKGIMLAPYFSEEFAAYLVEGKTLKDEINIARHIKRYYQEINS
jgi:glycine oxidase